MEIYMQYLLPFTYKNEFSFNIRSKIVFLTYFFVK